MRIETQSSPGFFRPMAAACLVSCLAAVVACAPASSQEETGETTAAAVEVEAAFERFIESWEQEDLETAVDFFAPDAVAYDPVPPGKFEGTEGIRAWTTGSFEALEQISITIDQLRVQTAGPVAWLTADYVFEAQAEGETAGDEGHLSMVWVRQPDGSYEIEVFHASPLPE